MNKKILNLILTFLIGSCAFAELLTDDFVDSTIKQQYSPKPVIHTKYDYTETNKIAIKLAITQNVKSEKELSEGQILNFVIKEDVFLDDKIVIHKDTPVTARVETLIKNGMNGIPATIILGDFKIQDIKKGQLTEFYEIEGQDRSIIVFPLKWALTILPPSGSLTNFIKGGHAKIKTKKPITIYYHPDWL